MPSTWHEGVIALVRENPAFIADLVRGVLHVEVPPFTEARLAEASFNELIPAEYHADAVVLLSTDGRPSFGAILEVQLQADEQKRFTWPIYAVTARGRHQCPFILVAVTPDSSTARWAAKTIDLGGGRPWAPFVVGPEGVPRITDAEEARKAPELAVLSVMTHGKGDAQTAVELALAATDAIAHVPDEQRMLYLALIHSALGDAARKAFEMNAQAGKLISRWHTGSFEKGEALGVAKSIIAFLEARGLSVSNAQRERILGCTDLAQLDGWLRRAATVIDSAALFE